MPWDITPMKNMILCLAVAVLLSGCAGVIEKQQPVCTGTALVSGQESSVQIYGVRKQNNQTQYRAGYPFGWHWVSKNNFLTTTCAGSEK